MIRKILIEGNKVYLLSVDKIKMEISPIEARIRKKEDSFTDKIIDSEIHNNWQKKYSAEIKL